MDRKTSATMVQTTGQAGALPKLEGRVRLFHGEQGRGAELLGFAELTIGGSFVIRDIRVLRVQSNGNGSGEVFVSFPSKKGRGENEDRYFDIAHPITSEARQAAADVIARAYREAAKRGE